MIEDLQLAGMSERTQESYVRSVRQLAEYCGKSPDKIVREEIRSYFLHVKNEKKWARATAQTYSSITARVLTDAPE